MRSGLEIPRGWAISSWDSTISRIAPVSELQGRFVPVEDAAHARVHIDVGGGDEFGDGDAAVDHEQGSCVGQGRRFDLRARLEVRAAHVGVTATIGGRQEAHASRIEGGQRIGGAAGEVYDVHIAPLRVGFHFGENAARIETDRIDNSLRDPPQWALLCKRTSHWLKTRLVKK